ncbi:hypothetical protein KNP414_00388 [Paenibacillus mucilaginosus KNP414]|uniref:Uncharacterized protein n=1 Tax=Paenibacillus mucilaginosus (strain KNP414) TaxID=1036673 RepID=F8FNH6_PAEMK|nr:hypothetical protein KNP414_00388 [Paenibacillus mucilaginosus KNP414]
MFKEAGGRQQASAREGCCRRSSFGLFPYIPSAAAVEPQGGVLYEIQ